MEAPPRGPDTFFDMSPGPPLPKHRPGSVVGVPPEGMAVSPLAMESEGHPYRTPRMSCLRTPLGTPSLPMPTGHIQGGFLLLRPLMPLRHPCRAPSLRRRRARSALAATARARTLLVFALPRPTRSVDPGCLWRIGRHAWPGTHPGVH